MPIETSHQIALRAYAGKTDIADREYILHRRGVLDSNAIMESVNPFAACLTIVNLLFIWIRRLKFKQKVKIIMRHYVVVSKGDRHGSGTAC